MTWIDKRRVRVSGGEFAVVDEGEREAPPVVLLAGGMTSSYAWRRLIPMLSPFMRVIAPDLLGSGDSEAADGADLRLASHAEHVRELLGALGVDRYALVGHGHGGGVAQLLALDGNVDALVLIDVIAFDAWPAPKVRELNARLDQLRPEHVHTWVNEMLDAGTKRAQLSEDDVGEYLRSFRGAVGLERFRRVAASFDGEGLVDLESQLAELEIPVFILWGEEDTFVAPNNAERLADVLPWSSVALLPGCGHFLLEDAADTVVPLIFKWLQRQYIKVEHRHEPDAGPVVVTLGRRPPGEE
ncbi:MAG TPA: alpha/beta hydrolase [Actinomycetota bacterium]|jgi:pimeloyl-ACP methyl ester carboxylesterase|nr:alpha/beta hydrolase [Actinomycetota bacterium]